MKSTALAVCAAAAFMSGCATITSNEMQQVTLTTRSADGSAIDKASCTLRNDRGTWTAQSPGTVSVRRSADDLMVECKKEGLVDGMLRAISRASGGMFGNIIFGGGIGAIIDHNKGTGYDYPDDLPVQMGSSSTIDKANERDRLPASTQVAAAPAQQPASTGKAAAGFSESGLPPVGTTWTYSFRDHKFSNTTESFTVRVTSIDGWNVNETVASSSGADQPQFATNAEGLRFNARKTGPVAFFELAPYLLATEPSPSMPFGKVASNYPGPGGADEWKLRVSSVTREEVTVPAGHFKAVRLEVAGENPVDMFTTTVHAVQSAQDYRTKSFRYTVWYSPETGRYVQARHQTYNRFGAAVSDEIIQLTGFKIAGETARR